jgi:hypothetical protein
MTKKLNESTVRRFMTMANLAPLSENFIEEKVNEDEEVNENEEVVEEAAEAKNEGEEAIDEAAEATETNEEVQTENLALAEDEEEELEMDAEDDMMDATADVVDAEDDMMAPEEEAGDDLAVKAQAILADLADLLTSAGIETTVTSDEEVVDDMADATDDMADAEEDMDDAEVDMELEGQGYDDKEDEKLGAEHGALANKDLDDEEARRDDAGFERANEAQDTAVDALVAEITSKVISRLNK